jgi:hypothetical protein
LKYLLVDTRAMDQCAVHEDGDAVEQQFAVVGKPVRPADAQAALHRMGVKCIGLSPTTSWRSPTERWTRVRRSY